METLMMISVAIFYLAFAWWVVANTETEEGGDAGDGAGTADRLE